LIGWLSPRQSASSLKEPATYAHREASTFRWHIEKIEAKAKKSDRVTGSLNGYIHAITQA
jgi:hypothetical protein